LSKCCAYYPQVVGGYRTIREPVFENGHRRLVSKDSFFLAHSEALLAAPKQALEQYLRRALP
jgi:hypothetical protein